MDTFSELDAKLLALADELGYSGHNFFQGALGSEAVFVVAWEKTPARPMGAFSCVLSGRYTNPQR